jgi:hypothetical protein
MRTLSAVLVAVMIACGTSTPSSDAGFDAKQDSPVDCSKIGCAMPPPCGQPCTEVCGCCGGPDPCDSGVTDGSHE